MRAFFQGVGTAQRIAKRSASYADVPVWNQFGDEFRFRTDLIERRRVIVSSMYTGFVWSVGACRRESVRLVFLDRDT